MKKLRRSPRRNVIPRGKSPIQFEEFFEKNLKTKTKEFLESDRPVATITKAILIIAALGGVIAVGAMAPNLFRILNVSSDSRNARLSEKGYRRLRRGTYQLRKRRLIEPSMGKDSMWHITELGMAVLRTILGITGKEIPRPQRWDGKYRIVFFDIPNEKREARDELRQELRAMGFYQFQKSVLAHPFPCEKEVAALITQLGVYDYVEICTIENLRNIHVLAFFQSLLKNIKKSKN